MFRTMYRSPSFAGVILAAGESSRMGRDKALLPWPPGESQTIRKETFLAAAIRSLSLAADFVLVVAGKNEANLAPIAYANAAAIIRNSDPDRGQFSSLQIGLREVLNRGRDAAIITLVDRPPAPANVVHMLRERFEAAPQNIWAVVPEFEGRHGHPFVAGREMLERFLREPVSGNARDVEHRHQEHVEYVTVSEPSVTLNINTPEDYAKLAQPS